MSDNDNDPEVVLSKYVNRLNRKYLFLTIVTLLLGGTLLLIFRTQKVSQSETIIISSAFAIFGTVLLGASAFMHPKSIINLSKTLYGYNLERARELLENKLAVTVGTTLILLSLLIR